jgi:predicted amidohydrolase YtcJ
MDPTLLDGLRPLAAPRLTSPERDTFLASVDGYSAFVDGAALQAAGLNPSPDPPGGFIDPAAHV